jgi:hypothetical protein
MNQKNSFVSNSRTNKSLLNLRNGQFLGRKECFDHKIERKEEERVFIVSEIVF